MAKEVQHIEVDEKPAEKPTEENGIADLVKAYRNRYPNMHGNTTEKIKERRRPFFAWNPVAVENDEDEKGEDELPYEGYVQQLD